MSMNELKNVLNNFIVNYFLKLNYEEKLNIPKVHLN